LEAANLPSKGLERTEGWVAEENGRLLGHVALERKKDAAVLRSLVVVPSAQGQGLGRLLMDLAEREAGNRTVLLRTRTIGPWAVRRGYSLAKPEHIPESIRGTTEFEGSLCSGFPAYVKAGTTEVPVPVPGILMTPSVTELAAISAAMASNCEPCFKFHYDKARKLGVSREDIRIAVSVGLSVKSAPHRRIVETADRYLASAESVEAAPSSCCAPSDPNNGCGCRG